MADQELGQIIDALGARADLDEGDLPTDAFVILKIVKADGTVSLVHRRSESLDWTTALGMITAAHNIENGGYVAETTDDP
ncbi:hypothetical protein [Streptomyces sp. enrichment culture]|uniref:hypothetical protein n=1 Tax=Streptomyces sp. enrichment culture TaxID=1795815 RepID=UPI003F5474F9